MAIRGEPKCYKINVYHIKEAIPHIQFWAFSTYGTDVRNLRNIIYTCLSRECIVRAPRILECTFEDYSDSAHMFKMLLRKFLIYFSTKKIKIKPSQETVYLNVASVAFCHTGISEPVRHQEAKILTLAFI